METFLTKTITIVALTCFLVVGAAATAILGRDSLPAARFELASAPLRSPKPGLEQGKQEGQARRCEMALAPSEPPQADPVLNEPLRQAYASTAPADLGMPKSRGARRTMPRRPTLHPPSQRPSLSRAPQKNYALLSDVQIAGIKDRLKLSASQESYWPPVETALRAVARKIHASGRPIRMRPACRSIPRLKKSSN